MQIHGRRYDTRELVTAEIDGGRVARVAPIAETTGTAAGAPWLSPGFVDLQVNGFKGQEFSSLELTPEKVGDIVRDFYAFGVTAICPTLTTQSFEVLAHGMRAIAAACESSRELDRVISGIHQEGPYLSAEDGPRGAHPAEYCCPPNWNEFSRLQEAAGGRIRLLTLSPEYQGAAAFIARAVASGVVVAIGHTAANSAQIHAAVDAGARLSTHLGNGAHRLLRRHPNYIWDQLAEDRLLASIIVDGHHLPGEVVKTIVRAKTPGRCILVSDVSGLAGLPPGRHASSGGDLEILPDGRLVIAGQDQLLAGASLPIGTGLAGVMRFAGVDLPTAVRMATTQPAELIGRRPGGLRPGDPADLVLFDVVDGAGTGPERIEVRATVGDGQVRFGQLWKP